MNSRYSKKSLTNGLTAAALLAALFALPSWAADQTDQSDAKSQAKSAQNSDMPATESQSELLRSKPADQGTQQPEGVGQQADGKPATKSQEELLRENSQMSHDGSAGNRSMSEQKNKHAAGQSGSANGQ